LSTETFDPITPAREIELYMDPWFIKTCETRWEFWEPCACVNLRRAGITSPIESREFKQLRTLHGRILARLLAARLEMRTIRMTRLDDPFMDEDLRAERVRIFIDKRTQQLERRPLSARKYWIKVPSRFLDPVDRPTGLET
jgi:hypothetical protein